MNSLVIVLLLGCGTSDHGHSHGPGGAHDHGDPHDHGEPADDDEHAHDEGHHGAEGGVIEAPLGAYIARLKPSAGALELVVLDGEGEPVAAEGEAKVVLTGTGEEAQRVVLTASGDTWTGAAKAEGASGYLAVVNVSVGGHQESARLTWGAEPAPHDHGDEGHGHDH